MSPSLPPSPRKAIKSYEKFSNTFAKSKQCEVRWLRYITKTSQTLALNVAAYVNGWWKISITFDAPQLSSADETFSCNVSLIRPWKFLSFTRLLIFMCCFLSSQNPPDVSHKASLYSTTRPGRRVKENVHQVGWCFASAMISRLFKGLFGFHSLDGEQKIGLRQRSVRFIYRKDCRCIYGSFLGCQELPFVSSITHCDK